MADERGGGRTAGPLAAFIRTRDRAGGWLVTGGVGAALRLRAGRVGAPVRPQRELGVAATGAGGGSAGSHSAAGARGPDSGAGGDEVSGAGGTPKPGGLPAPGGDLRPASLRYAWSRPTVWGLAPRFACGAQTPSGRSGAVFQDAATGAGENSSRGALWTRRRTVARPGDGGGDGKPRATAAVRRCRSGTGSPARRSGAASARPHSKAAAAHRRKTTGARNPC